MNRNEQRIEARTPKSFDIVSSNERVLAISFTYRGFGFTVFENANTVVDWGHCNVENHDDDIFLKRISSLIENNQVDTVLSFSLEDKPPRVKKIAEVLKRICKRSNTSLEILSKDKIALVFESFGSYTKYQRAGIVAAHLPDLSYKLPKQRKVWQSEDLRMAIFDSACLALSYFYLK